MTCFYAYHAPKRRFHFFCTFLERRFEFLYLARILLFGHTDAVGTPSCPDTPAPQFVRNGTITFEYRVDAERGFDFFSFEFDENVVLARVSQQLTYTRVSYNVPVGVHVFKWKYAKDFSISYGDDTAFLRLVEVTGTAFADSSCSSCPTGTYADKTGSSTCTLCPGGTSAENPGSSVCEPCRANEYSFPGADRCYPSAPCVESDVMSYYSECFSNQSRAQYFYYQTPKICSENVQGAYRKPADRYNLECAPCAPGTHRNSETGQCESCPNNQYSSGNNQHCQSCPAGHAGRRDFIWNNFDTLPPASVPATMNCTGECGTNGWRLSGQGYIDSGVNHGAYAMSSFSLDITTVSSADVVFNVSFSCARLCFVSLVDQDITGSNATDPVLLGTYSLYSFFFSANTTVTRTIRVPSGSHRFSWVFSKFDGTYVSMQDHVKIYGIQVESVIASQGGAASCQPCEAGSYVSSDAPYCQLTPPGTYTGALATRPSNCPVNTFSEFSGATTCAPCGAGTTAAVGSSWCDESCRFRYSDDITYDLKQLARIGGDMYGPITGSTNRRSYYLNVCTRDHSNATCVDEDGRPLSTQSCMTDDLGFGLDLGRVTNFYAHPTTPNQGLTIVYRNSTSDRQGSECRLTTTRAIAPRSTNITFTCDPLAGYGYPEFVGTDGCATSFSWSTLFACPACDDSDYDFYYTECVDGKQFKTYKWKDNPRKCHSGDSLPAPEERTCSVETQIPCPAGTYLLDQCTDCPAGTWSLGGAKIINNWPHGAVLDSSIFTVDPAGSTSYVGQEGSYMEIKLPFNALSTPVSVTMTFNFVDASNAEVRLYLASIAEHGYLATMVVDESKTTSLGSNPTAHEVIVPMSTGTHTVRLTLHKMFYTNAQSVGWIRLYKVYAIGTSKAAALCTDALPGTFSTDPTREPSPCPMNTFQPLARRTSCDPVPAGRFAPPGSKAHFAAIACTAQDYDHTVSTDCQADGKMTITLRPRANATCMPNNVPTTFTAPCACPFGSYRTDAGVCQACPDAQPYDAITGQCTSPVPGTAGYGTWSFLQGRTSLPPQSPPSNLKKKELLNKILALDQVKKLDAKIYEGLTLSDLDKRSIVESEGFVGGKTEKREAADAEASWYTTCVGTCQRPWTFSFTDYAGPIIDSGLSVGSSISILSVTIPMSSSGGQLAISYRKTAGLNTELLILVDGSLIHSNDKASSTTDITPMISGAPQHEITFVLIAKENVVASSVIRLTKFSLYGAGIGGKTLLSCPAGYYSAGGASAKCTPCAVGFASATARAASCTPCADGTYAAFAASTKCETCPTLTSKPTEAGSVHGICQPLCTFGNEDDAITAGERYDWNDLMPAAVRLSPGQVVGNFPELMVTPCASTSRRTGCIGTIGEENQAFVCGNDPWAQSATTSSASASFELLASAVAATSVNPNNAFLYRRDAQPAQLNYGTVLESVSRVTEGQLLLTYTKGDYCPTGERRFTKLTLTCPSDSETSQANPTITYYSFCRVEMTWVTSAACKACTTAAYRKVLGECRSRQQSVLYVLKDGERCHHSEYTQPASFTQPCSSIHISIGFIVAGVICLALLVVSVAVFCLRHKKLSTEYHLLKAAHDGSFADNETQFGLGDDDDDGVTLDHIDEDDDDGLRLPTSQTSDAHDEL